MTLEATMIVAHQIFVQEKRNLYIYEIKSKTDPRYLEYKILHSTDWKPEEPGYTAEIIKEYIA